MQYCDLQEMYIWSLTWGKSISPMHLVFILGSWLKASKTVGISCDTTFELLSELSFGASKVSIEGEPWLERCKWSPPAVGLGPSWKGCKWKREPHERKVEIQDSIVPVPPRAPPSIPCTSWATLPAPWVPGTQIPQQLPCTLWITICRRHVGSKVPLCCPQQSWKPVHAWCTGAELSVGEDHRTALGKLFLSGCTQRRPPPGCLQLTADGSMGSEDPRSPQG